MSFITYENVKANLIPSFLSFLIQTSLQRLRVILKANYLRQKYNLKGSSATILYLDTKYKKYIYGLSLKYFLNWGGGCLQLASSRGGWQTISAAITN